MKLNFTPKVRITLGTADAKCYCTCMVILLMNPFSGFSPYLPSVEDEYNKIFKNKKAPLTLLLKAFCIFSLFLYILMFFNHCINLITHYYWLLIFDWIKSMISVWEVNDILGIKTKLAPVQNRNLILKSPVFNSALQQQYMLFIKRGITSNKGLRYLSHSIIICVRPLSLNMNDFCCIT